MQSDTKQRILDVLKRNQNIPIYKIAKESQISIATASKYCYVLEAENKIKITSFGNMKLVNRK
jgi:predicted transcriptional regulator